jgi:hypothetical protein
METVENDVEDQESSLSPFRPEVEMQHPDRQMSEWLVLLLHIRKVPGSYLGPISDCPDRLFVVSSEPPRKCQGGTLSDATTASFHIPCILLIILSSDATQSKLLTASVIKP